MKKNHIPAVHPGQVFQDELEEIVATPTTLAKHIGVLPKTIKEICRGKRGIRAEMPWRPSKALGGSPNFWLSLQANWELSQVDIDLSGPWKDYRRDQG